jgi:predicted alpha/beta-hydrolase family hydrolase
MNTPRTLDIRGYEDRSVANVFFHQATETNHLAIVYPGAGYTAQMPVLYYPTKVLLNQNADVLRVDYAYLKPEYQAADEQKQREWFEADVLATYEVGLQQRRYEQVTLIGKSLGTLALGHVLTAKRPQKAKCVWLTPLLGIDRLYDQIMASRQAGLFVIGTSDSHYHKNRLAEIEVVTQSKCVTIAGADHSLEIANNVVETIKAQIRIVEAIEAFLRE